jgi:phospholipase D1/2
MPTTKPELARDQRPSRRMPRRTLLRFLVIPALLAGGYAAARWTPLAGYLSVPALEAAFGRLRQSWWAPALLIGAYLVLSPVGVPATPLMVAGGMVFGGVAGSIYNWLGVVLGAAASFFVGRVLGRDFVRHIAGHRLRKVELAIGRHGFWNLVAVRFLPLPFPVVNYGAALAGVRPSLFLASTAIGVAPTVTLYTLVFATLAQATAGRRRQLFLELFGALLLLLLVTLLPQLLQARRRRQRLAALRAARRARAVSNPYPPRLLTPPAGP